MSTCRPRGGFLSTDEDLEVSASVSNNDMVQEPKSTVTEFCVSDKGARYNRHYDTYLL